MYFNYLYGHFTFAFNLQIEYANAFVRNSNAQKCTECVCIHENIQNIPSKTLFIKSLEVLKI